MNGWARGFPLLLDQLPLVRNVAAVALAWLLTRPTITSPIIGANTPQQLAELLPAAQLQLTADEARSLDDASS